MITNFRPRIKSRHPSHSPLRRELPLMKFRSVVRMGSITEMNDSVTRGGKRIECNTVQAVRNSANKLLMKKCFSEKNIKTADWWICDGIIFIKNSVGTQGIAKSDLPYPIVAKHIFGSRGTGNHLLKTQEELTRFLEGKDLTKYIFEKFYSYAREYRLHVTKDGCFYTCRKLLKEETPEENRWYRNDSNCVWVIESNSSFDKPTNWTKIEKECVKALNSVGLDIGACDVKVQSSEEEDPKFIIIEINSAPSYGNITLQKYLETIPKVLKAKHELLNQ